MLPFSTSLYYRLKRFLPLSLRMAARRWHARRVLKRSGDVWPIDPVAATKPDGWPGWPDGKEFAFVLTHDVEGPAGLDKVRPLAELEMSLGFRSCFNFIPEGPYRVPAELRAWLVENGFEVGVHDLHHDGGLYRNREHFRRCAQKINGYLADWNAVGFRPGFMLRHLDWLKDLEILWDSSTFDTDPFEPQPDGVRTVFPFWVARLDHGPKTIDHRPETIDHRQETIDHRQETIDHRPKTIDHRQKTTNHRPGAGDKGQGAGDMSPGGPEFQTDGYVELPYTLPQDSTLFLVLREKSPEIWLRKLDWIAQHGGMALVNVHPDYLCIPGAKNAAQSFPLDLYKQLLEYVRTRHSSAYWHSLPRDVAVRVCRTAKPDQRGTSGGSTAAIATRVPKRKIWIDLENTPHIPFFKPIIRELEKRGYRVVITARDAYQTCEMAEHYGLAFTRVGHHYGKHKLLKAWGFFVRSLQLRPFAMRERPCLGLNHGSRTQTFVCNLMGIPVVTLMDYEHSADFFLWRPDWKIMPSVVPDEDIRQREKGCILKYSGIKEDVYVPDFTPDGSIRERLGLDNGCIVVTVRPPATEAHYHNPESEMLFAAVMKRICETPGVCAVVLPRNKRQETAIRATWPEYFRQRKAIIPEGVIDGLNLIWHSDLVVSGGGTMNREAAALGVPVYSIFRGPIGAVDRHLAAAGRLTLVESVEDVGRKIGFRPRSPHVPADIQTSRALEEIVGHIEKVIMSRTGEVRASMEHRDW